MMRYKNLPHIRFGMLSMLMILSVYANAAPIIVEGAVPTDADKQVILSKLRSVYGPNQVVDKIQVKPVAAPADWTQSVTEFVTPNLKKVTQGRLAVHGTQVELSGKVLNPNDLQATKDGLQASAHAPYQINSTLAVSQNEQKIVDDALKKRIVEFKSGSAILTTEGQKVLDEMVIALNKVQGKNVKITGYTDSSGDAQKNLRLSQERAEAVKSYLVEKKITPERLMTQGLGAQNPVADNATLDGRRKNRRIEFEVL